MRGRRSFDASHPAPDGGTKLCEALAELFPACLLLGATRRGHMIPLAYARMYFSDVRGGRYVDWVARSRSSMLFVLGRVLSRHLVPFVLFVSSRSSPLPAQRQESPKLFMSNGRVLDEFHEAEPALATCSISLLRGTYVL